MFVLEGEEISVVAHVSNFLDRLLLPFHLIGSILVKPIVLGSYISGHQWVLTLAEVGSLR